MRLHTVCFNTMLLLFQGSGSREDEVRLQREGALALHDAGLRLKALVALSLGSPVLFRKYSQRLWCMFLA